MKVPLLVIMLAIFVPVFSYGQSQQEINNTAKSSYAEADRELNTIYQEILKQYSAKPKFISKFKSAQRLWIQLRNADLSARYPEKGTYGTSESACAAAYLESLTRERIKVLRVWLDGIPEGDVCNGSVKSK